MQINPRRLSSVLVLIVAATSFHAAAIAQPASSIQPRANETVAERFNQAFFSNAPDFFRNRSLGRQLNFLFGSASLSRNSFPENDIARDAAEVHNLYRTTLEQQVSSDPVIRTPDLPNPYDTSILSSPALNVNNGMQGNEIIFERQQSQ